MRKKVVLPACLKDFACTGADCSYTCCQGWRIDVDAATAKKYKKCKDEEWSDLLKNNLEPPTNKKGYYTIKLTEEGYCPFLRDGLCGLQKKFGGDFLGIVCNAFPRCYNYLPKNKVEKGFYLACPEVVRSVLLTNEKMSFIEIEEDINAEKALVNTRLHADHKFSRYFYDLRNFSIDILQSKHYSLQDKLIILAYFFDNFSNDDSEVNVEEMMKSFEELVATGLVGEFTKQIMPDKKYYYSFLRDLLTKIYGYTTQVKFHSYAEEIYNSLGLKFETEEVFFNLYDEYYRLFLQKNSLVLENYLVYEVFFNLFPFNSKNIWDDFVMLVLRYAIANFFLFGVTVKGKVNINEDELLKCFVILSKVFDSSVPPTFAQVVLKEMKEKKENNILNIFKLIKV